MKNSQNYSISVYSLIVVVFSLAFTVLIINPIWINLDLHVPGEPNNKIDFTQPVDTIFYIRNVEGYHWSIDSPTSLWFHPILSLSTKILPSFIQTNIRLWIISLLSAFASLVVVYEYITLISPFNINPKLLLFIPLLSGGLGIATGNAEFPCLLFTTLLLISVLKKSPFYFPLIWGTLAILTKPNALYMIPILGVYFFNAQRFGDTKLKQNSAIGILIILFMWISWIIYVDIKVGSFGAYWDIRNISTVPLTAGPFSLLQRTVRTIIYQPNSGEVLKYIMALLIPLVNLWITLVIQFKNEAHRLSIIAGFVSILAITFLINNPNKIVVYVMTIPCNIAIGLMFIEQTLFKKEENRSIQIIKYLAGVCYLCWCLIISIFYILGTPLGWYY